MSVTLAASVGEFPSPCHGLKPHLYTYTCTFAYTNMFTCVYIYVYYTHIYIHIYIYIYIYIHIYIYSTYTVLHIHNYIYVYISMCLFGCCRTRSTRHPTQFSSSVYMSRSGYLVATPNLPYTKPKCSILLPATSCTSHEFDQLRAYLISTPNLYLPQTYATYI